MIYLKLQNFAKTKINKTNIKCIIKILWYITFKKSIAERYKKGVIFDSCIRYAKLFSKQEYVICKVYILYCNIH